MRISYFVSKLGLSGRGPITAISPFKIFIHCGISSILVFSKTCQCCYSVVVDSKTAPLALHFTIVLIQTTLFYQPVFDGKQLPSIYDGISNKTKGSNRAKAIPSIESTISLIRTIVKYNLFWLLY
jgi:hypothetical protein